MIILIAFLLCLCTFYITIGKVSHEYFSDANQTWRLSLFRCNKYEAELPHEHLRADVTALAYSCQSVKGDHLGDFGVPQIKCSLLLSGAGVESNA